MRLDVKPSLQKRCLKAFIDLAIMRYLSGPPLTGYGLSALLMKKIGFIVNPGMIYSSLSAMERKGWIKCVRNRTGRAYSLTEQGKEIAHNMNSISEESCRIIRIMLKT